MGLNGGEITSSKGKLSDMLLNILKIIFPLRVWLVIETVAPCRGLGNYTEIIMVFVL